LDKKRKPKFHRHRNTRTDITRLREIAEIVKSPLAEFEHIHDVDKIAMVMQYERYPIYARKIKKPIKVRGLWWLDPEQWAQYMWNGHGNPRVIKDEFETDRVLIDRTFSEGVLWIRDMGDRFDLEGRTRCGEAHKRNWEWVTVSVTPAEYKRLDEFLGPPYDGCRHDEECLYVNRNH
jgi:hypothetical protein